jgi:type IV pilus assembly protein PilA
MNQTRRRLLRKGFSLIELLIVIAIILIIAAIAVPKLDKARQNAQEMAAIRQIMAIHTAQTQYYSQFSKYAATLAELGPPPNKQPGPNGADLLPGDLALGKKTGYLFKVDGVQGGYAIHADPETYNSTGRRSFFSDQTLVVRENWGNQPATAESGEIK